MILSFLSNASAKIIIIGLCVKIIHSKSKVGRFLRHGVYIGWQWRNFFKSYLCQLFFRHVVGQALQNVSYSDITFIVR